jgi:prepilin-type N-terminal cleavage/methylation domain-containing protein
MKHLNHIAKIKDGFSLVELMVIVAIIGILSSAVIIVTNTETERAKINSVQIALAGWLQVVQRSALLERSDDITEGGCEITLNNLSGQANGALIAEVDPTSCSPNPQFSVEISNIGNSTVSTVSTASIISFTPRGTILIPGNIQQNPSLEYRISLSTTQGIRCVRISGLAGVIELGSGPGPTPGNACTDYTRL